MPTVAWILIPTLMLIALLATLVAVKPSAADAIATVLRALETPLRILLPWRSDATEDDPADARYGGE